MQLINKIERGQSVEYQNDNIIIKGDIGEGASVTVIDGNLTVEGNIASNVKVNMTSETNSGSGVAISNNGGSSVVIGNINANSIASIGPTSMNIGSIRANYVGGFGSSLQTNSKKCLVHGDVGDSSSIYCQDANIEIVGYVGSKCELKTLSGNIDVQNHFENCTISSTSGNIDVSSVQNSQLKTTSGYIKASSVKGCSTQIKTVSGDIVANNICDKVNIKAVSGCITVEDPNGYATINTVSGPISYAGQPPRRNDNLASSPRGSSNTSTHDHIAQIGSTIVHNVFNELRHAGSASAQDREAYHHQRPDRNETSSQEENSHHDTSNSWANATIFNSAVASQPGESVTVINYGRQRTELRRSGPQ